MTRVAVLRALWPWLVALGAVLGFGCEERRAGRLDGQVTALTKERDALAKAAKTERLVFVHDTVRLTQTRTRYETVRDSVIRTDTLLAHDTTFIRVVAAADTTIHACRETVAACVVNLRIADSLHAVDTRLLAAYRHAQPSGLRRWGDRLLWASAGYAVGHLLR